LQGDEVDALCSLLNNFLLELHTISFIKL